MGLGTAGVRHKRKYFKRLQTIIPQVRSKIEKRQASQQNHKKYISHKKKFRFSKAKREEARQRVLQVKGSTSVCFRNPVSAQERTFCQSNRTGCKSCWRCVGIFAPCLTSARVSWLWSRKHSRPRPCVCVCVFFFL